MKWFEIEYSGGGNSKRINGQTEMNLDEVLNTANPPKFIKVHNIAYNSKITNKYELFDKWDSKWSNEMWINTDSIIAIRANSDDLLTSTSTGEWNAFSERNPLTILISKQLADDNRKEYEDVFLKAIDELAAKAGNTAFYGKEIQVFEQQLLPPNEFIIVQYGREVLRKTVTGDIKLSIIAHVQDYLAQFAKEPKESEENE